MIQVKLKLPAVKYFIRANFATINNSSLKKVAKLNACASNRLKISNVSTVGIYNHLQKSAYSAKQSSENTHALLADSFKIILKK